MGEVLASTVAPMKVSPSPWASPETPVLPSSSFFLPNCADSARRAREESPLLTSCWIASRDASSLAPSLAACSASPRIRISRLLTSDSAPSVV